MRNDDFNVLRFLVMAVLALTTIIINWQEFGWTILVVGTLIAIIFFVKNIFQSDFLKDILNLPWYVYAILSLPILAVIYVWIDN